MNAVKLLGLGAALVALGAGAGAGAQEKADYAKQIVGKWTVTKADVGTVPEGTVIEFTKDGKLKITHQKAGADVALQGTYKVEKDAFTFTIKVEDGVERKQTITITKMTDAAMSTKDPDGKVVELTKAK